MPVQQAVIQTSHRQAGYRDKQKINRATEVKVAHVAPLLPDATFTWIKRQRTDTERSGTRVKSNLSTFHLTACPVQSRGGCLGVPVKGKDWPTQSD